MVETAKPLKKHVTKDDEMVIESSESLTLVDSFDEL
jgi:hypothetical protein